MAGAMVVRELLTKIGFQVDKAAWDKIKADLDKTKKKTDDTAKGFEDLGKKIDEMAKAVKSDLRAIDEQSLIFGRSMDANRARADRLKQAIVALTEQGVRANSREMQQLVAQYRHFNTMAGQSEQKANGMKESFGAIGGKLLAIGAGLAGAGTAKKGFDIFSDFDSKLREVSALTQGTANDLAMLREAALREGQASGLGARQAADGLIALSSAGFEANEQMKVLPVTLKLARAGGVEVADAAELAGGTLRQFNLDAGQASRVGNVLAQTAADSAISLRDLAYTMKMGATTAASTGQSLEEVATFAAVMGNRLIRGEQGGTILRGALTELLKPTEEQAALLQGLGVSLVDVRTKAMLPLSKILDQLRTKLSKYGQAQRVAILTTIFGKEPLAGISAALNISGDAYEKQRQSIMKASGALDDMTGRMDAGPKAALGRLSATIETMAIRAFDKYEASISGAIKKTDEWFKKLGSGQEGKDDVFATMYQGIERLIPKLVDLGKFLASIWNSQPVQGFLSTVMRIGGELYTFLGNTAGRIAGIFAAMYLGGPRQGLEEFVRFVQDTWLDLKEFVRNVLDEITGFIQRTFEGTWVAKLAEAARVAAGLAADQAEGGAGGATFAAPPPGGGGNSTKVTVGEIKVGSTKEIKPAVGAVVAGTKSGASGGSGDTMRRLGPRRKS